MIRDIRFAWLVALLGCGVALFLGLRLSAAQDEVKAARILRESQQKMEQYASDMQSATFVRSDNKTIVYRTPQEVKVGNQTFVNSVEQKVTYSPVFTVFGAVLGDGPDALKKVRAGAAIRVLVRSGAMEAMYVSP